MNNLKAAFWFLCIITTTLSAVIIWADVAFNASINWVTKAYAFCGVASSFVISAINLHSASTSANKEESKNETLD